MFDKIVQAGVWVIGLYLAYQFVIMLWPAPLEPGEPDDWDTHD